MFFKSEHMFRLSDFSSNITKLCMDVINLFILQMIFQKICITTYKESLPEVKYVFMVGRRDKITLIFSDGVTDF